MDNILTVSNRRYVVGRRKEDMDPQLLTAIAGLLTAVATLVKVLQHDGIIKETVATTADTNIKVTQTQQATNGAISDLATHMQALASAANTFAQAAKYQQHS